MEKCGDMKAKTLAKILACVLGMAVMIGWMVFISGGFSKKLVSNSPAEVPGGCIDVYLTGTAPIFALL